MFRFLLAIFSAILLAGCSSKNPNEGAMRLHDDGRAKPCVTIVPMLDSTTYDIPWSLSEEFSSLIKNKLSKQADLYVAKDRDVQLSSDENPFDVNLSWIKKTFNSDEFVVFLEMIEHEDVPIVKTVKDPNKLNEFRRSAANLNMAIRLRIIDVRGDKPKIVLQEMLKDSYYMANTIDKVDYNSLTWGSEEYKTSPMGIAHAQFARQIIERIYDYIMLAKSM
jgi:hypothetical protein